MGNAADRIIAHYKAHEKQWVDVPEWPGADGKPLRIFWKLMTVHEAEEFAKTDASTDLDIFVRFARDAENRKLFDAEDKLKLRVSADSSIISRVARLMVGPARTLSDMVDDAEKN
jgi:hypothetical protein